MLPHNPRHPIQGEHNGHNAHTSRLLCSLTRASRDSLRNASLALLIPKSD